MGRSTMWRAIELHAELPSTNQHLTRLPAEEPEGLVVVTDHQTAGAFASAIPGRTLIASFLIHFTTKKPGNAQFAGSVALLEAIQKITPDVHLRWPGAICAEDGRTVAGIRLDLMHDNLALGFGINVEHHAHAEHRKDWTSLNDMLGESIDRWELLGHLMKSVSENVQLARTDPKKLYEDYIRGCDTIGRMVRVTTSTGVHEGRATEITPEGELVIELGGNTDVVMAGELEYLD